MIRRTTRDAGIVLAVILSGCTLEAPPVWEPGDRPLHVVVWGGTDAQRADVARDAVAGCGSWRDTIGVSCGRDGDPGLGRRVVLEIRDAGDSDGDGLDDAAWAWAEMSLDLPSDWLYGIVVDPAWIGHPAAARGMAHEFGHLQGAWDHLDGQSDVMSSGPLGYQDIATMLTPTRRDVAHVAAGMGMGMGMGMGEVGQWSGE